MKYLLCAAALALSACSGLKPFPTKRLWEFDPKAQVCAEYAITDTDKLTVKHLRDVPLAECPAIFGFLASDIPKVLDWARAAREYAKAHCK
jgi:hypothetical protein